VLDGPIRWGSGPTDVKRGAIADCTDLVGVPTWRLDRYKPDPG